MSSWRSHGYQGPNVRNAASGIEGDEEREAAAKERGREMERNGPALKTNACF